MSGEENTSSVSSDSNESKLPLSTLLPTSTGHIVSSKGLLERIIDQFRSEFDDSRVMSASPTERRTMVRDVAQYVINVENVVLAMSEQAQLIQQASSELFGFGELDALLQDDTVTTIVIDGVEGIAVRRGPGGELESLPTVFDDHRHLTRIVDRLLLAAGVQPGQQMPIIETGLVLYGRRAGLNVAVPPFVPQIRVDIRLHGREARTLEDWLRGGIISEPAARLIEALADSPHGIMIVGDTESGKTTLLNILCQRLTSAWAVVERAPEMHLNPSVPRLTVSHSSASETGYTLAQRVEEALAMNLETLLLDEVRADEPEAVAPLLLGSAPRLLWTFRGTSEAKRIKAALTILVQRAIGSQSEEALQALAERLPFVILLKRRRGGLRVVEIAEWQQEAGQTALVGLMRLSETAHVPTGRHPQHPLNLPTSFWRA
jgi:pilus assembly protein CpaF